MKYLTLTFFVLLFTSLELSAQELLSQRMSSCDQVKRPDILKDRIIESTYHEGVFYLHIGYKANCAFSPKVVLERSNDTLFMALVHKTDIMDMCDCCYEMEFVIKSESAPSVVMLKKKYFDDGSWYGKIVKSEKWYRNFSVERISERYEQSTDSLFLYSFQVYAKPNNNCEQEVVETLRVDSTLADSADNILFNISDCSESLPFVKTSVYNFDKGDSPVHFITGKETNFDGDVSFCLGSGKKLIGFRSMEHIPVKDTFIIENDTFYQFDIYMSYPDDYWEYSFHSTKKLEQKKIIEVARRIFLDFGVSPEIKEEYPFVK